MKREGGRTLSAPRAFSRHLHGRVGSGSNHSSLPDLVRGNSRHRRAQRASSTGAGQRARGCKVILVIIQQAAVRCKERTKKKKKKRRRGLCPKSPQTMLFINSQRCFTFTIPVIKNSNIVLSAISCRSGNGRASRAAEAEREAPCIKYSLGGVGGGGAGGSDRSEH